jgi:hypothetical protein
VRPNKRLQSQNVHIEAYHVEYEKSSTYERPNSVYTDYGGQFAVRKGEKVFHCLGFNTGDDGGRNGRPGGLCHYQAGADPDSRRAAAHHAVQHCRLRRKKHADEFLAGKIQHHRRWYRPTMLAMQQQADAIFLLTCFGGHQWHNVEERDKGWDQSSGGRRWQEAYEMTFVIKS